MKFRKVIDKAENNVNMYENRYAKTSEMLRK